MHNAQHFKLPSVPNADGTYTLSETFPVDRGVVQGDIVSPLCFIIALHRIRQLHDIKGGVKVGELQLDCLEYAGPGLGHCLQARWNSACLRIR